MFHTVQELGPGIHHGITGEGICVRGVAGLDGEVPVLSSVSGYRPLKGQVLPGEALTLTEAKIGLLKGKPGCARQMRGWAADGRPSGTGQRNNLKNLSGPILACLRPESNVGFSSGGMIERN